MATEEPTITTEDQPTEESSQPVTDEQEKQESSAEEQTTEKSQEPPQEAPPETASASEQQTEPEVEKDVPPTEPTGDTPQETGQDQEERQPEQIQQTGTEPSTEQVAEGGATQGPTMSAVVIGGTGAIGKNLVAQLLKAKDKVSKVTLIGRRKQETVPEQYEVNMAEEEGQGRLVQHVEDMDAISSETIQNLCTGANVFYCTLGTTKRQAGSAAAFYHIDYDIPLKFIQAAKAAGVGTCSLVTSMMASASSFLLYTRTKGELEEATRACEFSYTFVYRPGLLGRGDQKRFGEKLAGIFFKEMPVATVAQAMVNDSYKQFSSPQTGATNNFVTLDNRGIYQSAEN